jgi:hypothetical protein
MAINVKKAVAGNAPATGTPKQPRGRTFVAGPDIISKERGNIGGAAYGENHWTGGSSSTMDKVPQSPMAAALKVSDDGVLAALVAGGSAKNKTGDLKSSQLRTVDASPFPAVHGAVRQQADYSSIGKPTLPASQSDNESEPDRQP